ncbi:hypothetical protein K3495_g4627 [Podosphaera aphanis]|nr:hypothetical protein K3495_g4627 [Podosphaera aphanis]
MALPSDAKAPRSVPFDELYDISDQEDVKVRNLKRTAKERGKAKTTKKSHNHANRKQRLQDDLSSSSPEAHTERMEQQTSTKKSSKLSKPSLNLTHNISPTPSSRWHGRRTSNMALSSEEPNTPHHGNEEDYFDFSADEIDASTPLNNLKANKEITSNSSSARKRKRSELQIPQSSPIVSSTVPLSASNPSEIIPSSNRCESGDGYVSSSKDEGASEKPVNDRSTPSDTLSSILAPPKSSSSLGSSPLVPSRNLRSSRARTPQIENDCHSDLSSPPSLTHSPDLPAEIDMSSELLASLPSNFSTAQLQALLPRRRKRRVRNVGFSMESDNEVDISSLASDDDELLYFPTHKRDHNQRQVSTAPKGTFSVRKNVNTTGKKKAALLKKCATLKRKSYEKKEIPLEENSEENPEFLTNDENASENSQELEKRIGKELKMATRKFQEIDKWQLDFEEVTVSGSSSPNDAR